MGLEPVIYPFLFIGIFFESFLLVTFLSKPAREHRRSMQNAATPKVAIIVPCWNEEMTIAGTIESLLALDYPKENLSIILVNDGSTDATPSVVDRFSAHPQITALHKENGGKFTAMNLGIAHTGDAEIVGFLDADSLVAPDALREIVAQFYDSKLAAVTASMSIHQPRTMLQRMQHAEYSLGIAFNHILASINGLHVTPGPFSFYRRSLFPTIGLFRHAHLAEDMEMALRIQRAGMKIGNALRARVYTKGPPTLKKLIKQRVRWITGFLRNILFDYRDLLGTRHNSVIGTLTIPLAFVTIFGTLILFPLGISTLILNGIHAFSVIQAAPLSYVFSLHPFSWFYAPITATMVFSIVVTGSILSWMIIGKTISRTPGKLLPNIAVYLLLYGFVAPLWLIRSVSDVARGIPTTWR